MSSRSKFEFFEKVRIVTRSGTKQSVNGAIGAVLGKVQDEGGIWYYAVHVYGDNRGWDFVEDELEATGEFDKRESFYDGSSIRVRVDSKGRGFRVG